MPREGRSRELERTVEVGRDDAACAMLAALVASSAAIAWRTVEEVRSDDGARRAGSWDAAVGCKTVLRSRAALLPRS
jgi:hypothetical protein